MGHPCKLVVLISGRGSNLAALLAQIDAGQVEAQVVGVISNRVDAGGLQLAAQAGIATRVLEHGAFADRQAYDQALMAQVDGFAPDLVVLAGFMRILTPGFVRHYQGRLLNIHPSLLPRHKGLHTHRRALEAGDREHGCSVHFVTEELDGGPLVIQGRVTLEKDDTEQTLARKVQLQEHRIYPLAIGWFALGRLRLGAQCAELDGVPLTASDLPT